MESNVSLSRYSACSFEIRKPRLPAAGCDLLHLSSNDTNTARSMKRPPPPLSPPCFFYTNIVLDDKPCSVKVRSFAS